jgi:hypothetical protein
MSTRRAGERAIGHHDLQQVMHDPVDIRRRIDVVDDIEAWRAEIRRRARADRIKVRTGFNEGIVLAK